MSNKEIIQSDGYSFDGESFTIGRVSTAQDVLVSNTEGPIHLKTLCRVFGIDQIETPSDEKLEKYDNLVSYLKSSFALWLSIKKPLSVEREKLNLQEAKTTVSVVNDMPSDIVGRILYPIDGGHTQRYNPKTRYKPASVALPNTVSYNSLPIPDNIDVIRLDDELQRAIDCAPPPPPIARSVKKQTTYKKSTNRIPSPTLECKEVPEAVMIYTRAYILSKGHKSLEGKDVKTLANIIARLKPKASTAAQRFTDEIVSAILKLNQNQEIELSISKKNIAPYIPEDIETLSEGGECADVFMADLYAYHMTELSNIHKFDKLVNMISNSCLRKLCSTRESLAPAYYAAAKFVRNKIYIPAIKTLPAPLNSPKQLPTPLAI